MHVSSWCMRENLPYIRNISKHQVKTLTRTNLSNPNGQPIHLENFTVFSRWDRCTILVLDNERTTLHIQFDTIHRQQQNRATSCNMHWNLVYESKPKRSEICDLRLIEISIKGYLFNWHPLAIWGCSNNHLPGFCQNVRQNIPWKWSQRNHGWEANGTRHRIHRFHHSLVLGMSTFLVGGF